MAERTNPWLPITIHSYSKGSIGNLRFVVGSSASSNAYPAANRAIFVPFRLESTTVVKQLFCYNGATASGNIDIGIYTMDGTKLISSGSVAQSGTNAMQSFDVADTTLAAGAYYMAIVKDDTTGTMFRINGQVREFAYMGVANMSSAFPLPASATLVTVASGWMPFFGLTGETVL